MKIKALIVDDEKTAREIMSGYLKKYCPDVELLGEADNIKTASALIHDLQPDLVFLDVEMPFGNAFDLLDELMEVNFETVFVTAYSNYAIQALNCSAAYYLLKPVDIDELTAAVEKVRKRKQQSDSISPTKILVENLQSVNSQFQKVVLPLMEGFEVVQAGDIIRCEANDNFTLFHLADQRKILICRTLKFYEEALTSLGFVRIHKSHLINILHMKKYIKGKGGQVVMADGSVVDVSPNRKDELMKKF